MNDEPQLFTLTGNGKCPFKPSSVYHGEIKHNGVVRIFDGIATVREITTRSYRISRFQTWEAIFEVRKPTR